MIQPNDLRIGNFISICEDPNKYNDYHVVTGLKATEIEIHDGDVRVHEYFPIPLTEEWLVKLGFNTNLSTLCAGGICDLYFERRNNKLFFCAEGSDIKEIEYVHQLQNLYFALTGEELTVKETV